LQQISSSIGSVQSSLNVSLEADGTLTLNNSEGKATLKLRQDGRIQSTVFETEGVTIGRNADGTVCFACGLIAKIH